MMWWFAVTLPVWVFDLATDMVPTGVGGQWELGALEGEPSSPTDAWGTRIDGNYLHNGSDQLEFELPVLDGVTRPVLVFHHWYAVAELDAGWFEIDQGAGFERADPIFGYPHEEGFVGASSGWEAVALDLTGVADASRVRLVFESDASLADLGWYFDGAVLWDGDPVAPSIEPVTLPVDIEDVNGPYLVAFRVEDDREVASVNILWRRQQDPTFGVLPMEEVDGVWLAEIPGQSADTTVEWHVEASDGENVARWPSEGEQAFRVFLGAPTALTRLDEARVAQSISLSWVPPISAHDILEYEVWQEGQEPHRVWAPPAVLPLAPGGEESPRVQVRAIYTQGYGDSSEPLDVEVEVPVLASVLPGVLWPDERVRLSVEGQSLYALDQATEVSLGEDVTVESVTVRDVNRLDLVVKVSATAEEGDLTLVLDGPQGHFVFPGAVQIGDADLSPPGLTLHPERVAQGAEEWLELEFGQQVEGAVQVIAEGGLYVGPVEPLTDHAVRVRLSVAPDASVGAHTVQVTDGNRWWTHDLHVVEVTYTTSSGCDVRGSTGGPSGGLLWWAVVLGVSGFRGRRSLNRG